MCLLMNSIVFVLVTFKFVFSSEGDVNHQFLRTQLCPVCIEEHISNSRQQCDISTCTCGKKSSTNLTSDLTENTTIANVLPHTSTPTPSIYCIEADRIAFVWRKRPKTFYSLEYYTNPYDKRYTDLTRCGYYVLTNLSPHRRYVIVLHSYTIIDSEELTLGYSEPLRVATRDIFRPPHPVRNFIFLGYSSRDEDLQVSVQWDATRDLACFFEIVVLGEDYWSTEITNLLSPRKASLPGFSFGKDYSIRIIAFTEHDFHRVESEITWLNITTPSCYDTQTSNLCVPEQPQNVTIEEHPKDFNDESPLYNVFIYWSMPRIPPEYYVAKLQSLEKEFNVTLNITGDSTNCTIPNVRLGYEYQIFLIAYSRSGMSTPVIIHRHINGSYMHIEESHSQLTVELIVMLIVSPIIIIGIILMFTLNYYFTKKTNNKQLKNYFKEHGEKVPVSNTTSISTISGPLNKPDKWELDPNKIVITDFLGEGEFGIVRKGWYSRGNGENVGVAIKMLRDNATEEEKRQLTQEMEIMKSVPAHPHLVALIGCITRSHPLLITEFCCKGNLQNYLRAAWKKLSNTYIDKRIDSTKPMEFANKLYEFSDTDFDEIPLPKDLISFARQISVGMEYLASLKLIHRDLAARNILVYDKNTVKISDFGLSRDVYYDNVYCKVTGGKLPLRWMAIESMTHQVYTTQSDVWSFGVLLWEIVTMSGTPYPGVPTKNLLGLLKQGYRMEKPSNCSDELYHIMLSCWNTTPNERPTFTELKNSFETLLEQVSHYLNLDYKEPPVYINEEKSETLLS